MTGRIIHTIVIHCSASPNGKPITSAAYPTAAQVIDVWHSKRGFNRTPEARHRFQPMLKHIGYHYVIDLDGTVESGRHQNERGAHAAGHNVNSLGVCLVGTDKFTLAQWHSLNELARALHMQHPRAGFTGHRNLSPDKNGDGHITPNEWTKICPGFDVTDWWLMKGMQPMSGHIFPEARKNEHA